MLNNSNSNELFSALEVGKVTLGSNANGAFNNDFLLKSNANIEYKKDFKK
jgi:hypothetical protein